MSHVARIHNSSIASHSLLRKVSLSHMYDLPSTYEWNLTYKATDSVRVLEEFVLAGQILDSLKDVVDAKPGSPKFGIQFGAYGSLMAFFGLAQLRKFLNSF
ncbi:hypothetical protein J3459_017850 [Metarhizium acridum]|nr:hypothetical protein J3459_017850 [Metarhizium acridum]